MILSEETNIWESKQNKKIHKATVRPIMSRIQTRAETKKKKQKKTRNVGSKWAESTKKNSWKSKNR